MNEFFASDVRFYIVPYLTLVERAQRRTVDLFTSVLPFRERERDDDDDDDVHLYSAVLHVENNMLGAHLSQVASGNHCRLPIYN